MPNGDYPNIKDVLVVDDSMLSRMMLIKHLKKIIPNATIKEANNGADAVALCEETPSFNIVFMDFMMPEMTGLEAAKLIIEKNNAYKIAMVTANIQESTQNNAEGTGCIGFINKSIKAADIIQVLDRI